MGFLHHWNDEDEKSFEELRDGYVNSVDDDAMASLNEIRNVHNDADCLSAKDFCEKYGIK